MGGADAIVALRPVGLELDGLLGVGKGLGELSDGGVGGGSVGVEDVVVRGEVREAADSAAARPDLRASLLGSISRPFLNAETASS